MSNLFNKYQYFVQEKSDEIKGYFIISIYMHIIKATILRHVWRTGKRIDI